EDRPPARAALVFKGVVEGAGSSAHLNARFPPHSLPSLRNGVYRKKLLSFADRFSAHRSLGRGVGRLISVIVARSRGKVLVRGVGRAAIVDATAILQARGVAPPQNECSGNKRRNA